MRFFLIFPLFPLLLSSCATPLTWDERLAADQLTQLQESRQKFERISQCSKDSKDDETKFNANCAQAFSGDSLVIKVRKVYVHGFKYAIEGDLSENISITCEVTLDKKMTEEKLATIKSGQMLTVTGPISNYLKTSQSRSAKFSPCTILSGL